MVKKKHWCPNGCGKKVRKQDVYRNSKGELRSINEFTEDIGKTDFIHFGSSLFFCVKCHKFWKSLKDIKKGWLKYGNKADSK